VLLNVELPDPAPARVRLFGLAPRGVAAAFAVVGREGSETGGSSTEFIKRLPRGGPGVVDIDNPGRFSRLTAVMINADTKISGFSEVLSDWAWDNDLREIQSRLSTDFDAPSITSRGPRAGARRVSTRTRVVVRFSEPMVKLTTSTVKLIGPNGKSVRAKVALTRGGKKASANGGGDRVVLTPRARLGRGKRYTVKLSRFLRDRGGNALRNGPLSWSFRTKR
jgi:hypothetical protein